jgi:Rps23 Pro-64 3,4-dihydroxylase Tpa1-like proline 4-hydroxylase
VKHTTPLFDLNPAIDRSDAACRYATEQRIQLRDVLTVETARTVQRVLAQQTLWGLAWTASGEHPQSLTHAEIGALPQAQASAIAKKVDATMRNEGYGFLYSQYPMLDAYKQKWAPGGPHDLLLEHINNRPFLDLVREVTGIPELVKADAQATLYAPNQFLAMHDDSHPAQARRVAYVLNFCTTNWRPDWGGYLLFYDADGDVVSGFKPRFNSLNLFTVPQAHNVSYVPPFAPVGRLAITGWFRDR